MNISPFDTLYHDPIVVILRRTSLNGLSRIGQTCKTFDQIVRSIFSKNQTDLKSLLESGKRYVHLIAPCLARLKTMRAAELLYSEESFIRYAKALAGTIALKIEENLSGASSVKMDIDRLFGDRELFILLERSQFCQFLAEAFTNEYLASKSSSAFYNRCVYLSETMNRPFHIAGLLLIFEKMYSSYKQALLGECPQTEIA